MCSHPEGERSRLDGAVPASLDAGRWRAPDGGVRADGGTDRLEDAAVAVPSWITVKRGALPVVLSAPHGGTKKYPGVPKRTRGTRVTDSATYRLALAVHEAIARELGRGPHLVASRLSRDWVDYNRAEEEAYEHEAVAPIYDAYHRALRRGLDVARRQSSRCALLLDVHGQSSGPARTFRGTRNGATATLDDLYAKGALLDVLADEPVGLRPERPGGSENPLYRGGFIVSTYGRTHASEPADAVQLELGWDHRHAPRFDRTVDALAGAVASHIRSRCPEVL